MTSQGTAVGLLTASSVLLCTCFVGNLFILEAIIPRRFPASIRALPTNELIIGSLAMSNVLNGVLNFLWLVVYLLSLCQRAGGWVYKVLDPACMIATSSSFYFTACLSAFYTFKISSFGPPWLASLRQKAPISMPHILLLLLLASSIISVPTTMFIKLKEANGSDLHCGDYYELSKAFSAYSLTFTILAYMVPLAVLTICSVLLIVSLCHHSRRMGGGARAAVHRRVAKMMLVLLVFYALCVVFGQVSIQLYTEGGGISDWFVTSCFVVLAYSSGCPFVVTWGTVRLHQRLLEIYSNTGCCVPQRCQLRNLPAASTTTSCSLHDGKLVSVSVITEG